MRVARLSVQRTGRLYLPEEKLSYTFLLEAPWPERLSQKNLSKTPIGIFLCSCFLFFFLSFCPFCPLCTFISCVLMSLILYNAQHKHSCPGGIRTRKPSKRSAADPCLRPLDWLNRTRDLAVCSAGPPANCATEHHHRVEYPWLHCRAGLPLIVSRWHSVCPWDEMCTTGGPQTPNLPTSSPLLSIMINVLLRKVNNV